MARFSESFKEGRSLIAWNSRMFCVHLRVHTPSKCPIIDSLKRGKKPVSFFFTYNTSISCAYKNDNSTWNSRILEYILEFYDLLHKLRRNSFNA